MKKIQIKDSTLEITRGDITKQETEAVVNAANKRLAPGGGVAGAIRRVAGPKLFQECKKLGGCKTGEAKITKGYNLPAKYIIHTVVPIYSGSPDDPKNLASCYKESLKLAKENNIESISFPSISTGYFGYPMKKAAKIALDTVIAELRKQDKVQLVRFVLYDTNSLKIHEKVLNSVIKKKDLQIK